MPNHSWLQQKVLRQSQEINKLSCQIHENNMSFASLYRLIDKQNQKIIRLRLVIDNLKQNSYEGNESERI